MLLTIGELLARKILKNEEQILHVVWDRKTLSHEPPRVSNKFVK